MRFRLLLICCILGAALSSQSRDLRAFRPASAASALKDTLPPDSTLTHEAFAFLISVFSHPEFQFQTLQPDLTGDIQSILIRFNNAIVANKQWFQTYRDKYAAAGQPLPYNERFGITPQEYQRLQHLESEPPILVPVDSQRIKVIRDGGFIHFRSESESHLIDYLLIDSAGQQLLYGSDTIPLIGRTSTGPSSPYGQWQGFTWRMQKTDVAGTLSSGQATARIIEVNLGLTMQGRKVFLRIKYQDMKAGTTTANMELLGYIR